MGTVCGLMRGSRGGRYRAPCRATRGLAEADVIGVRAAATRVDVAPVVPCLRESRVKRYHVKNLVG